MKDVSELFKTSQQLQIFDESRCRMAAPAKLLAEALESARLKNWRAGKDCRRVAAGREKIGSWQRR
jgi:hypothetical protein